jgi:hypothetical protein
MLNFIVSILEFLGIIENYECCDMCNNISDLSEFMGGRVVNESLTCFKCKKYICPNCSKIIIIEKWDNNKSHWDQMYDLNQIHKSVVFARDDGLGVYECLKCNQDK